MNKEHILREVRRTAEANGGKPLGKDRFFNETGIKDYDWLGKHWARWNDVLREAGYGPNQLQQPLGESVLLGKLADLTRELGHVPVVSEMRLKKRADPSYPNDKTYDRFGNKQQLLARLRSYCESTPGYEDLIPLCGSDSPESANEDVRQEDDEGPIECVYLLKSGRFYKIGRSNSVGRREREISLQLPDKVTRVHTISTDDAIGIEAYWHQRFADKRKNGEWFDLTASDVKAFRHRKFM